MSSSWIGDLVKDEKSPYSEEDADPIISVHAIHWLICIETYNPIRAPSLGTESIWELGYNQSETCIYKKNDKDNVIIAFRGTKNPKDWYDDMKITFDQVFPRAKEAEDLVRSFIEENPTYTIQLTGHSLGGAIAREVGKKIGLRAITFNAAAPPTAPVQSGDNEIDYHIVFDIISAWQSPYTIRIDKGYKPIPTFFEKLNYFLWLYSAFSDVLEAHKLHNFSRDKSGVVICGEQEHDKMNSWVLSLPSNLRSLVYVMIFGVSGEFGLPDLEGCFYGVKPSKPPPIVSQKIPKSKDSDVSNLPPNESDLPCCLR